MRENKIYLLLPALIISSVCWQHVYAQSCPTPSFNEVNKISACRPSSITKSDFNQDGKLDIAFTNNCEGTSPKVTVLLRTGAGSFTLRSSYIINSSRFVTTGDFNNDARVDLVISNYASNTVSVLLGDGTGNFGPPSYYPVGMWPWGLTVGDFNKDNNLDVAVANSYFDTASRDISQWVFSDSISILLGDGTGGLGPATSIKVGNGPMWLTAEDFNDDGKLDLAVANTFSNNVCILSGNGKGSFDQPTYFPVMPKGGVTCVAAGDFNGDKKPDLAATNYYQDAISILLNTGHGSFGPPDNYAVGMGPFPLGVEDLNHDGKLDLAVVNLPSDNLSILLGNGSGGFEPSVSYQNSAHADAIAIGDFNEDGNPDLAISNLGLNNITLFWGDGTGAFAAPGSFPVASTPHFISKSDFNQDGNLDLVTVNAKTNNISILAGDGKGGFGPPHNFAVQDSAQAVVIGDFNGDGDKDLVVTNYKSNNISVLLGDDSGQFALLSNITVGAGPCGVATGDFNGDGHPDLAVTNAISNNVSILLGTADGTFSVANNIAVGNDPRSITVGDFNGDGNADLAVANYKSNNVSILAGNGSGSFYLLQTLLVGINPFFIVTSDFNINGIQDLAVANWTSNSVSVFLGNGDGSFIAMAPFSPGVNPRSIDVADLNGDGKPDLAIATWGVGTVTQNGPCVSLMLGNGSGGFTLANKLSTTRQTNSVVVGDFDKNGYPDIVTSGYYSTRSITQPYQKVGFVSVFLNTEKPKFFVKSADPSVLYPPNHKMIDVTLNYWAMDNCPGSLTYELLSVTSNEPESGLDGEDVPNDILIIDDYHIKLRAERSSSGNGRIYTTTIKVVDASANFQIATIPIVVEKDASITQSQKLLQVIPETITSGLAISVFPNPAHNNFAIQIKAGNQTEKITLQIFDVNGRLVETKRITSEFTEMIGKSLSPGMYLFRVIQGKTHEQIKVIKLD